MALQAAHVLIAAIDKMSDALAAMSDGGYRRRYRGVRRYAYDLPSEEDMEIPWVQVDIGESGAARDEANDRIWWEQEITVQVHVKANQLADGAYDAITPALDTVADIHQAVMADRNLGVGYAVVFHRGSAFSSAWSVKTATGEIPGTTVRETYAVQFWFQTGDMGTAP